MANLVNVKEVGDYAFADCAILSTVNIPVIERIGEGAFGRYAEEGSAPQILNLTLPQSLTYIGEGAFLGCESLLEVTVLASLDEIPNYSFAFCLNLEKVTLPESVNKIGLYAFARCTKLTDINLEKVEVFDDYSFAQCEVLESVDLTSATTIGEMAFGSTWVEGDLTCENLTYVGPYAFQMTYINSFNAPNLATIGEGAFYGNKQLTTFEFSSKLEKIEAMAFIDCVKLATFTFNGVANDAVINDYAKIEKGGLYTKMPSGGWLLSSIPADLKVETFEVAPGTTRIEFYAGNENKNVKNLILPDGLKLIGNYAFYAFDSLNSVEFRSVEAPALEDSYNSSLVLEETDPGFDMLHATFNLFGFELYYCNFIDMLGKKEPINMVLPSNEELYGYNALSYAVYFGDANKAQRSEYVAKEKNLILFVEYAKEIENINNVSLTHEKLITSALTAYNGLTQKATDFGYTQEEWDSMVDCVNQAKATLTKIKLEKAVQQVRDVQALVDGLDKEFDIANLEEIKAVATKINELTLENRAILDLTEYNKLLAQYNAYLEGLEIEIQPVITATKQVTFGEVATVAMAVIGSFGLLLALAFIKIA